MSLACPRPERLARFATGEADAEVRAHALACEACAAAIDGERALIELCRATPAPRLDARRRDSLSAMVLSAPDAELAPAPRASRWAALGIVLAAAAGFAVVVVSGDRTSRRDRMAQLPALPALPVGPAAPTAPPTPTLPAPAPPASALGDRVTATPGARYHVRRHPGDVLDIRLEQGALTIDGRDRGATEVVIGDRRVAASADARYVVDARDGGLHSVQVFAGSVEIAGAGRGAVVTAGETWVLEAPVAAVPVHPRGSARVVTAPATTSGDAAPRASSEADASAAFQLAWAALDAGRFADASAGFEAAAAAPALAEDATYWGAIARARAGDASRARSGLVAFLARFPRSPHVGAAHLTLGRLLADQPDVARPHLEAAAADPDPRVSAAAKAALAPR